MAAPGSRSEGFRIMVLPVMVAIGMHHNGTMAGKSGLRSAGAIIKSRIGPMAKTY
jgi:hypothetical protein